MTGMIIDPTVRRARPPAAAIAPRPAGLAGRRVGLLGNTKRNADAILDAVGRELEARFPIGSVVALTKTQFAMPLPADLVEQVRNECDVVVIGVGDCGSCSASAVADALTLEATGIPAAVICTEVFDATARAMAALKNVADYPVILMPHPIANLSPDLVTERAAALVDAVAQRLVSDVALVGAA